MNKTILSVIALSSLLTWSFTSDARTTRDLVFEDEDTEAAAPADSENQTIAVKTTVVLTRDGNTSTVVPNTEFKSGDKVKLVFTPNIDGYVYWLAKGTTGSYTMLFPNPKSGADNSVKKNEEYTVPSKGVFKFDDNPGNEELLCILSADKLPDLDAAASSMFKDSSATAAVDKVQEENSNKRQTRDLVFEDEDEEDVNTVKQSAPKGEPFVAQYILKHN